MRYGILGAGFMGQEHMRNIGFIPECYVSAFYEPDAGMRAAAQALAPDATAHDTLDSLVLDQAVDTLVIATPNNTHAAQLQQIAALRTLPMLVEKPLVTEARDKAVIAGLADYAAPIWVGMEYRYMPPIRRFLEEVEAATGGVRHLSIREHRFPFLPKVQNWNRQNDQTGGTLVEKCCHFFDLMRLIVQDEPVRVMGSGWQAVNHKDEAEPSDIWDAAFAIVDFSTGPRAMLDLCMFAEGARWQEEITAVGPKGRIDCLIPTSPKRWPDYLGPYPEPKLVISPRDKSGQIEIEIPVDSELGIAGDHHGSTYFQHLAFLEMLKSGGAPEVSLNDGWLAVQMGMAAQSASDTGQAVMLS